MAGEVSPARRLRVAYELGRLGLDAGDGPEHRGEPIFAPPSDRSTEATLALILPLLILLSTALFLLLLLLLYVVVRKKRGVILIEDEGPLDLAREEERDAEGGITGLEARWLESVDLATRAGYLRAKAHQTHYPPDSQPTDITLSQFLSIQEKGVSAWAFEPDYESNPPLIVTSRTELVFLADGVGLAREEGGAACIQSNLPLPRLNEVYYWEAKLFEKPPGTVVSVGLATKPFPSFRLPGTARFSVGYSSADGFKCHNWPFNAVSYGSPLIEGDVIGVGYRPRTGAVFFTKNGRKLEDAYVGLNKHNVFPTVGCSPGRGPDGGGAVVHVNLGQAGFVFIEANVKKWGLAPSVGTLAPPPAYGAERGSILLAAAAAAIGSSNARQATLVDVSESGSEPPTPSTTSSPRPRAPPVETSDDELPHNPPTPHITDISLHSFGPLHERQLEEERERADESRRRRRRRHRSRRSAGASSDAPYDMPPSGAPQARDRSPPAYHPIDQNTYAPGVAEAMLSDTYAAMGVTWPSDGAPEPPSPDPASLSRSPRRPSNANEADASWLGAIFGRRRQAPAPGSSGDRSALTFV